MLMLNLFSEEGPNTELAWILWVALGFFLLMVIIGWLVSRNKKPVEAPVHAHGHDDDLEIIEGIGPKVAKMLKAAGIVSFHDLANAQAAKVEEILKAGGLNMMNAEGWIEQARLAEKGDMDGLKKMQAAMKGGRIK